MKRKTKRDNIFKATVIVILKDGTVISGQGAVEGLKSVDGNALITTRFYKKLPKGL